MPPNSPSAVPQSDVRAGVHVSVASVVWTVVSSTTAIGIGLASGSLVLLTFGLVGMLDAAGSTSLVVHFRNALRHDALSDRHERIALRIVSTGLIVVGIYGVAESAHRLINRDHADASEAGIVVAAASTVVLGAFFLRKRRVAGAIPSRALHADAWLSATGASLAVLTLVGTAASAGRWWMDPVAAAAISGTAIALGVIHARD